jgi:hypothetical protein
MKHDLFEFNGEMSRSEVAWRVAFLLALIGILLMDLLVWRPA